MAMPAAAPHNNAAPGDNALDKRKPVEPGVGMVVHLDKPQRCSGASVEGAPSSTSSDMAHVTSTRSTRELAGSELADERSDSEVLPFSANMGHAYDCWHQPAREAADIWSTFAA
jgi:hypothetical protein